MLSFLQRYFLTGLLAITPLAITAWILWRFYEFISANIGPLMERVPGLRGSYPEFVLTAIGVVVFIMFITLVGLFTRNLIGVAFFRLLERVIHKIPVVKSVFSATKQISEVFLKDSRTRLIVPGYMLRGRRKNAAARIQRGPDRKEMLERIGVTP